MAELTIDPSDITAVLRAHVESWTPSIEEETVGFVTAVADGVARVSGLPNAAASELLEFPGGLQGVALNLDEGDLGVVLMGDASHVEEGDPVKQTGTVLSVPVGDGLLGRVVDRMLQFHGGYGYSKEYEIERLYREAAFMLIGEGTSDIQKMIIGRSMLKEYKLKG